MLRRTQQAAELLSVAQRLRGFARATKDIRYHRRFQRGAEQLELEAIGCASIHAVAEQLRTFRKFHQTGDSC